MSQGVIEAAFSFLLFQDGRKMLNFLSWDMQSNQDWEIRCSIFIPEIRADSDCILFYSAGPGFPTAYLQAFLMACVLG